jgi:hypothetical protein
VQHLVGDMNEWPFTAQGGAHGPAEGLRSLANYCAIALRVRGGVTRERTPVISCRRRTPGVI